MNFGWCLAICVLSFAAEESRVELEIVLDSGFPIGGQQEWLASLAEAGADNLRMRSGKSGDKITISKSESGGTTTYKVIGVLTAENQLKLPGGTYRRSDMARLGEWIKKLKTEGLEEMAKDKNAFGMSSEELVDLHDKLSVKLLASTKGVPIKDVVEDITDHLDLVVTLDESARKALQGNETMLEELKDLTSGTALAACIRPLGLVVVPTKQRGRAAGIQLLDSTRADEHWPIGWPTESAPHRIAPKLFEYLEVEIEDFALNETLDAIEAKVNIPFLYDQNSLARNGIEMDKVKVSVPAARTYYYKIIRQILAQSKPAMKPEVRVDEAGNPFLWLSTYK